MIWPHHWPRPREAAEENPIPLNRSGSAAVVVTMDLFPWTNVRPARAQRTAIPVALAVIAVVAAGCGTSSSGGNAAPSTSASPSASPASAASPPQVSVTGATVTVAGNPKLGNILVDAHGRTLYLFEKDTGGKSSCSGSCASVWPPLMTSGKPMPGVGVSASALGTTSNGGNTQVTYRGRPLYHYVSDSGPGQAAGQGLTQFGAQWHVLSPSGQAITSSPGSPGSSSGGGYGGGGYGG